MQQFLTCQLDWQEQSFYLRLFKCWHRLFFLRRRRWAPDDDSNEWTVVLLFLQRTIIDTNSTTCPSWQNAIDQNTLEKTKKKKKTTTTTTTRTRIKIVPMIMQSSETREKRGTDVDADGCCGNGRIGNASWVIFSCGENFSASRSTEGRRSRREKAVAANVSFLFTSF